MAVRVRYPVIDPDDPDSNDPKEADDAIAIEHAETMADQTIPPGPGGDDTVLLSATPSTSPATTGSRRLLRSPAPDDARIGRYVKLGVLGRGGMGVVISAFDPILDRKVAIKLLRPRAGGGARPEAEHRLLREAKAMAKLSHPNVVVVHEVGTFADQVFVAMEHVAGCTLREWVERRPRSWREIVGVYLAAGRGLAAAHREGLVHRDFKPENVLIGNDDRVRVTDFGLVSTAGVTADEPTPETKSSFDDPELFASLTRSGALLGTPAYMAPEQHAREQQIDARADQFAFCVALYESLFDQRPFAGDSYELLAASVRAGEVRPPPRDSSVPGWVQRVVNRGLALDPAARYPSIDSLLADLEADPASARSRRRRIAGLAVAMAALVGVTVYGRMHTQTQRPSCREAAELLAGIWDPPRRAAVKSALLATARPYSGAVADAVTSEIDSYTAAWVIARNRACAATRIRGEQSEKILDLRMSCLDQRLEELRALVDLFADQPDVPLLDRAVSATAALSDLAPCNDVAGLNAAYPPPGRSGDSRRGEATRGTTRGDQRLAEGGPVSGRARSRDLAG